MLSCQELWGGMNSAWGKLEFKPGGMGVWQCPCSNWRWSLGPEVQQASGCAFIITTRPSTRLRRTSGGIGSKCSQRATTPSSVCLCSVIYSALSSGSPSASLLWMMAGCCCKPARPRSNATSIPSRAADIPHCQHSLWGNTDQEQGVFGNARASQIRLGCSVGHWDVLPKEMWELGCKFSHFSP